MKKKILLSAMISMVFAGGTLADVPFHGFYAGGGLTYSKGNFEVKANNFSPTFSSGGPGINGFLGVGTVIYSGLYLGGELGLGYDGSRFRNETFTSIEPNGVTFEAQLKSKSKFIYNIVGRIGYVFFNFLPYAKIGFEGRSKVSALDDDGSVVVNVGRNGVLLGVGGDYAVTQNIFLRAEYTYNFGAKKKNSSATGNTATFRTPTKTILIGAGYKF